MMEMKHCTCGAEVDVRRSIHRTAGGNDEIVYRVSCPVCGQLGPAIPVADKDEGIAIAEAVQAWNEMLNHR